MTDMSVLDQVEQSLRIPVLEGLQAQGDLIVIPVPGPIDPPGARWVRVPPEGVELLRGGAGGNTHMLVAEPGTCRWTPHRADWQDLGVFTASAEVYLLHPEHGALGCAPGTYVVRRQREHERGGSRLVAD
ncbi:hypothetical protein E1286_11570 [Nonomuraea terrae]|uniref:Uncharacterized protein n=1 Tax=Nonomuraea terrae TaxID=2530383 RepID=A0A4V2YMK3_9ACTN|nr:hypothetical protein [Nonomuraea terrae]TDD50837.1 hypothetical protein E1286_11570 [Nonomuraea terrae]